MMLRRVKSKVMMPEVAKRRCLRKIATVETRRRRKRIKKTKSPTTPRPKNNMSHGIAKVAASRVTKPVVNLMRMMRAPPN